jgi:hypothetical protein
MTAAKVQVSGDRDWTGAMEVMAPIEGNIAAARTFAPFVFFLVAGRRSKENARNPSRRRKVASFCRDRSPDPSPLPYLMHNFTCNLNEVVTWLYH